MRELKTVPLAAQKVQIARWSLILARFPSCISRYFRTSKNPAEKSQKQYLFEFACLLGTFMANLNFVSKQ